MRVIVFSLALIALCSGCASSGGSTPGADSEARDMPEYRTGSIMAVKKKPGQADPVKQASPEELEQARQQSSVGTR